MKRVPIDRLQVDKEIIEFIKNQEDITIDKYSRKGGNGELFFGTHNILKTRVALKFYHIDSKDAHEEAKLLHKIKHNNILEVLDAKLITNSYAYFLTPEISGGDLDKFMDSHIIDTYTALKITKGLLAGITVLHSESYRLVHRDLKPANILINNRSAPKIADFGSIKHIPPKINTINGSRHSFIYRPPESIERNEYSFQSDIYQIGIILFQLLGGFFPYKEIYWLNPRDRKKHSNIIDNFDRQQFFSKVVGNRICKGTLLDLNSLPTYICRSLKKIIRNAIYPDFNRRFKTTSEFLKAIHDYSSKAINWWREDDIFYALKPDQFHYRVILRKNKSILVQKMSKSNKWRADNKISGNLEEISQKINKL